MENDTLLWVEKYRPQTLDTYVGNEHLVKKVGSYIKNDDIPHLLLYGKAGTGKTTLAKLIVNQIDCDYLYINASDENNVDTVRTKIKTFASSIGFKKWKVVILDECDYITPNAQAALRNLMEVFSSHCRFILTCNYLERMLQPIVSRCQTYNISPPSKKEVALHLNTILKQEDVDFEIKDMGDIVNANYPDIRRIINTIQRQVVDGKLVLVSEEYNDNYKVKILESLKNDNPKDCFNNIRKILANSKINDFVDLFRYLYDTIDDFAKGSEAEVILTIAEYEFRDSQVPDKEINCMAMLTKIIGYIK
jgi:DNA polymerase III delta prime subunit|tara:strand:+ start:667 stop:1584 length:918 start_codon:yes stop_codon:yes gene_type:complete